MRSASLKIPKDAALEEQLMLMLLVLCQLLRSSYPGEPGESALKPRSLQSHRLYSPWNSPDQITGVGSSSFLQGIFPSQGLSPGLLHCRQILYRLSPQGSLRILEWQPIPSPGDFPDLRIKPGSPSLQADSLPAELPGKPPVKLAVF